MIRDNIQGTLFEDNSLLLLKQKMFEYPVVIDISHYKHLNDSIGPFIVLRMSGAVQRKYVPSSWSGDLGPYL
jgi:hypothetical protein